MTQSRTNTEDWVKVFPGHAEKNLKHLLIYFIIIIFFYINNFLEDERLYGHKPSALGS